LAAPDDGILPNFEDLAYLMDKMMDLLHHDFINGGMNHENLNDLRNHIQRLSFILDNNGFVEWRKDVVNFFIKGMHAKSAKRNFLIENVKTRLNENFSDQITLSVIAESFRINANYLSGLFKKETGINFNDYLTKIRINAAKKFLKSNQNYKVYEIAYMSGYPNERYFAKIFKNITGLTPLEYRNCDISEEL
jgi:two-component system response regulator YesN